ncbi:MAG TPA: flagellar biosynthesis anti-sigma factor FlgM [Desulfuromonadales bacterium]|jgi:anti-sigma28 factor (negative regulator of flagellin synthesis)|nr:flagellar biosynthesis anti-sigma factor FlgM [Desulfuromonadales bacterium]
MKVDARVSNYIDVLKNEPARPAVPAQHPIATQTVAEVPSVAIDFSSSALQLAEDEARRERLNIIRQQLAEGSYNISGKDVAEKMLKVLKG